LVITAAKLREEGKTIDEVVDFLVANRLKVNQFGTVESLEYLSRAGRVKASKAFFGKLFGIKPIIISDIKGQNYAFKKVKGAINCRKEIAALVAEAVINPEEQTLYLSHADTQEEIEALRDEILKLAAFKDVCINSIGPIVGASVGPGTVIAFCVGKEVTIEGNE
jgi:DegV family protein with EDD domain